MMRIAIVTDAWEPQVNGVVRTLKAIAAELGAMGHECIIIGPDQFPSLPCPTYREIRLALATPRGLGARLERARPDAIHIATEGPLGLIARSWCLKRRLPFTTAYHTQFPDYLAKRTGLPAGLFWRYIRWFHAPSGAVLASTERVKAQLHAHGLAEVRPWGRGVDLGCFRPDAPFHPRIADLPGPVLLYVGRIAIEKNIEAFLSCPHPGSKVLVGNGPSLASLKRAYPEASFLGALHGEELASVYASADVLVFPSRTDTFGLVMIEALACGTPVAGFKVAGPLDVLTDEVGCMDDNLDHAIAGALRCDRGLCANHARGFGWGSSAQQFLEALVPIGRRSSRTIGLDPAIA